MKELSVVLNEDGIKTAVKQIATEISKDIAAKGLVLAGIKTRGLPLAQRLAAIIKKTDGKNVPIITLDLKDNADCTQDIAAIAENKSVVIVDDVIYSGKTAKQAIELIKQSANAVKIKLAVLIDRGHREAEIQPDFVGKFIQTSKDQLVSVSLKETDMQDNVKIMTYD